MTVSPINFDLHPNMEHKLPVDTEIVPSHSPSIHPNNAQPFPFVTPRRRQPSSVRTQASWTHAPFVLLPPELLARIFLLGSQSDFKLPYVAIRVCRTFRHVALRTPELWRHIPLLRSPNLRPWEQRINLARACTLDIELSLTASPEPWQTHAIARYMHFIIRYATRWRSLAICIPHTVNMPYLANAALSGCCGTMDTINASNIEDIKIAIPHNEDTKQFTLFGGYAPRLRSVILNGVRLTWLPSLYENIALLDYTHHRFSWGYDAAVEIADILTVSHRLKDFRLTVYGKNSRRRPTSEIRPLPRIILPNLLHLELRIDGAGIPEELLMLVERMKTPNLRSLKLASNSVAPFPGLRRFVPLLASVLSAPILKLEVEGGWNSPATMEFILSRLPQLQHLVVNGTRYSPHRADARRPR
jgi:hypothetical protein